MRTSRSYVLLMMVVLGGICLLASCSAGDAPPEVSSGPDQDGLTENPLTPEPREQPLNTETRPGEEPDHTRTEPGEEPDHTRTEPGEEPDHTRTEPVEGPAESPLRPVPREEPLRPDTLPIRPLMIRDAPGELRPHSAAGSLRPAVRTPEPAASDPALPEVQPRPSLAESPAAPDLAPPSSDPPRSAAPREEKGDYSVVKVFYGTDRAVKDESASQRQALVGWLTWTLCSGGLTMILVAVGLRFYRTRLIRVLAAMGIVATIILGVMTVSAGLQGVAATGPSDRPVLAYGNERGQKLHLGNCQVSIPKDHEVGELESPSILRLEFREDPQRHVVLLDVTSQPAEKFYADLRSCVQRSEAKGAFIFVHGFNVTFEDAARRTAQIAYDLKFEGAPIFYSWPSQGMPTAYTVDEATIEVTVRHLKQFLVDVAGRSEARQVHLIAHSMGNRALTSALRDLSFLPEATRPRFNEVILTAPDVDAELFRSDIAPAIVKTAGRVTLYASSNDKALAYSKTVHGYPRAGDSGEQLVVVPGIDTIDVSAVDTSLLGHSYYGSNDTVLADLFELLHQGKTPGQRKWLRAQPLGPLTYWIFQRADDTARRAPTGSDPSDSSIR